MSPHLLSGAAAPDITQNFIKAKQPCASGYRWFLRRQEFGSSYQTLLDDLVRDGRVQDACWLLDQLGPTSDVLRIDEIDAPALVFAGHVECAGSASVDTVLRTGRGLSARGGVSAGERLQIGENLHVEGAVQCYGSVHLGGDARIAWSLRVKAMLQCTGSLRCGWELATGAKAHIGGEAVIGHDVTIEGGLLCDRGLKAGGEVTVQGQITVHRGIHAGGSVLSPLHIHAGHGILCAGDIRSGGAIRVGESLVADGVIEAGAGYGIFAGVDVAMDAWEDSARVTARHRPEGLISGHWVGSGVA